MKFQFWHKKTGEPSNLDQVEEEPKQISRKTRAGKAVRATVCALLAIVALAVVISTAFLPVLQVSGSSMEPTMDDGDVIVLFKANQYKRGDLVGLYHSGKVLLKRVIGVEGDSVVISEDGTVFVNGEQLDEPYVTEKGLGECDITFPYVVPANSCFVMGDHRSTSIDSRSTVVGSIPLDQIIGKIRFRVWPLSKIKWIP